MPKQLLRSAPPADLAESLRSAARKVIDAELRDWLLRLADGDTAESAPTDPEGQPCSD